MINEMMWTPLEFKEKTDNPSEQDISKIETSIDIKGMYEVLLKSAEDKEQQLIQDAKDGGYVDDLFLKWEEERCLAFFPILERWGNKVCFGQDKDLHFIFHKKYFKGTYIKKLKQI